MNRYMEAWMHRCSDLRVGAALLGLALLLAGCGGAKDEGVAFEQPTQPTEQERLRMEEAMKKVPVGAPQGAPPAQPR